MKTSKERLDQLYGYLTDILARTGSESIYSILPEAAIYTDDEYLEAIASEVPEVQGFAVILNHDMGNPFRESVGENLRVARAHSARWVGESVTSQLNKAQFLNPFYSQWGEEIYSSVVGADISKFLARKLEDLEVRRFVVRVLRAHSESSNRLKKLKDCDTSRPSARRPRLNLNSITLTSLPIEHPEYRAYLEDLTLEEIQDLCMVDWGEPGDHTLETALGISKGLVEKAQLLEYPELLWGCLSEIYSRAFHDNYALMLSGVLKSGSNGVTSEAVLREYFAGKERVFQKEITELVILLCGRKSSDWLSLKTGNDYVMGELWKATGSVETVVSVIREAALGEAAASVPTWKAYCDSWETMKGLDVNLALSLVG